MANRVTYDRTVTALTTALTTELNGLANDARKLGGQLDVAQNLYATFQLSIAAQGSARTSGARVLLYLIPSYDNGTTYMYGSDSLDPSENHLAGSFKFDASTTARIDMIERIELGAGFYKPLLINRTGQALAASGNVLSWAVFSPEMQ